MHNLMLELTASPNHYYMKYDSEESLMNSSAKMKVNMQYYMKRNTTWGMNTGDNTLQEVKSQWVQ